jgi:hypothetical protein
VERDGKVIMNGETGIRKKFVVACFKVEELEKSIQILRMARKLIKNVTG